MSEFDKIIGYAAVKKELEQITDTMKNYDYYAKLGVSVPRGLLLHGVPGVGKSLMASALVAESGRKVFVCRKIQPDGDFVKEIKATFDKAVKNAPSIVLLDDMDKFANGDERHPDAEEYVTVQSCIDEVKGKEVFVLATVNNMRCLPRSLCRSGRFDRVIEVGVPSGKDASEIIRHYLSNKKVVKDVDVKTIVRILEGNSCATLETIINEAGLLAGYERAECITMKHLLEVCMRSIFNISADDECSCEDIYSFLSNPDNMITQIIYHEAGHAVVYEILCPDSVNLVSACNSGGFINYDNRRNYTPLYLKKREIIGSLAGMAAIEQKFGIFDIGGEKDINQAFDETRDLVVNKCFSGFNCYSKGFGDSDRLKAEQEKVISAEVEKFYKKAKEIIALNYEFFEKIAKELAKRKLLTAIDIQKIKSECKIVSVAL